MRPVSGPSVFRVRALPAQAPAAEAEAFRNRIIQLVGAAVMSAQDRDRAGRGTPEQAAAERELRAIASQLREARAAIDPATRARWKLQGGFEWGSFWAEQDATLARLDPAIFGQSATPLADPEYRPVAGADMAARLISLYDADRLVDQGYEKKRLPRNGALEPSEFGAGRFTALDAILQADGRISREELGAAIDSLDAAARAKLDQALRAGGHSRLFAGLTALGGWGLGVAASVGAVFLGMSPFIILMALLAGAAAAAEAMGPLEAFYEKRRITHLRAELERLF